MIRSVFVNVRIAVEPKSEVHTSPERLPEADSGGNLFKTIYPADSVATDIIAIAESPLILLLFPIPRSSIATTIVTGITIKRSFEKLRAAAIAIAPNATWESPSPM